TRRGNRIVCVYIKIFENPMFTIFYSHPNATDIGYCLLMLSHIAARMNSNLFLYDYSGYGQSTGMATENNQKADADAAFLTLRVTLRLASYINFAAMVY